MTVNPSLTDLETIAPQVPGQEPPASQRMVATLAHELRGPLHALGTSAALLAEDIDELDPAQVRQMAQAIHRRAAWLQGLVENLLCAASMEQGGLSVHPQPLDLSEAVEEACLLVEPLVAHKRQQLQVRVPECAAPVLADRRRLLQAVTNLVQNASKFSDPGTEIEVALEPVLDSGTAAWRVTVADRGIGLPAGAVGAAGEEGAAERLFAPYYRAEEAKRHGKEGLGLGLAIVKSVADAHEGRVGAASRDGGGSCFWIEIPSLTPAVAALSELAPLTAVAPVSPVTPIHPAETQLPAGEAGGLAVAA